MQFVNIVSEAAPEELLEIIKDNERTNRQVAFEERLGKPFMHVREGKDGSLKIKCELMGRATKDNGFLEGTYFKGKIKSTPDGTKIKGVILTAPIFHSIIILLLAVFIVQCFYMGGFTVVPVLLVIFDIFMFFTEFKKQGLIKRYINRAVRRVNDPRFKK